MLHWALIPMFVGASTWTVDDDAPAHFSSIQAAVSSASVVAGDILLVEPGVYGAVNVTKPLTVLGRAGSGEVHVNVLLQATGISTLTVSGLTLDEVDFAGVTARVFLDDCVIGGPSIHPPVGPGTVTISQCADVHLSRCVIRATFDANAVTISNSYATLVDCDVLGGPGSAGLSDGYPGGDGVRIENATLLMTGGRIEGGAEGGGQVDGPAGHGIRSTASTLILRGMSTSEITGGFVDGAFGDTPGTSVFMLSGGMVVWGGLSLPDGIMNAGSGIVKHAAVPEPFLSFTGSDTPGSLRQVRLHGPLGASAIVVASCGPAHLVTPAYDLPILLDPNKFVITLGTTSLGNDTPATILAFFVPVGAPFAGLELHLQAYFPTLTSVTQPGAGVLTNSVVAVGKF